MDSGEDWKISPTTKAKQHSRSRHLSQRTHLLSSRGSSKEQALVLVLKAKDIENLGQTAAVVLILVLVVVVAALSV